MRLTPPQNPNYSAVVVKIRNIINLENCDNVVGTTLLGFQAIVGKDTEKGSLGIVFPAETQLSDQFCAENNLFRHSEQNKNKEVKGYIEDNRRIRAVKFRGHRSSALFMPLESLSYLGIDVSEFNEGDEFDEIGGVQICKKYEVPRKASNFQQLPKKISRVDQVHLPEHYDTSNYFKNDRNILPNIEIVVTQKLHGTSIRIANTYVKRKKSLVDRIATLFGAKIQEYEYDYVFGSKKVIKDINNPNQNHYYDTDLWTQEGKKLQGLIPEGFILYGELIGWTDTSAPIQSGYTYNLPVGTCELYIYRVAFVNQSGMIVDLTWEQLKEFCTQRGLKYVPEMWRGPHGEFKATEYLDVVFKPKFPQCLPLDKGTVDEGVCVRIDGLMPTIYKAKSPLFYEHETKLMDEGKIDLETNQNTNVEINNA